jgi:hypothetical protein
MQLRVSYEYRSHLEGVYIYYTTQRRCIMFFELSVNELAGDFQYIFQILTES